MTEMLLKYNLLDSFRRKEVIDFIDFLLNKNTKQVGQDKTGYKKKILKVSVWSEDDIDLLIQNQEKFNQWKAQDW